MRAKADGCKWIGVLLAAMFAMTCGAMARTGGWLDEIVFVEEPDSAAAVVQLLVGRLDVFAFPIRDPELYARRVRETGELCAFMSLGSYYELTFNTYGNYPNDPVFDDGRMNPFCSPRVREAMNWLIDRDRIARQIMGGLAIPRFTPVTHGFPDYLRHQSVIEEIEEYYTYDFDRAKTIIAEEMHLMGSVMIGNTWYYAGRPVEIIVLSRTEDERTDIGSYTADQLEAVGFRTERLYRDMDAANAYWISPAASAGRMHVYTGGWDIPIISRDQGANFAFFYTDMGFNIPLWQAYTNDPVFYNVARWLSERDYASMTMRASLFELALRDAMEESQRIWLADRTEFSPYRYNVGIAADLAQGIHGAHMWALTAHFHDGAPGAIGSPIPGGTMRIAMPRLLVGSWNPTAESWSIYDAMPIRATLDGGTIVDPTTGLHWAHKIDYAEITVKTDLPVGVDDQFDLDLGGPDAWIRLNSQPTINVPGDAWAYWDTSGEQFRSAFWREANDPDYRRTAKRKSVVYYPQDIFATPLHDGSTLSIGDFILKIILAFGRADPASPLFCQSAQRAFGYLKGVVVYHRDSPWGQHPSRSPLVIETYSDTWQLDAELNVTTWFPQYAAGPGFWHTLALGILNQRFDGLCYATGGTVQLLWDILRFDALPDRYIPYEPTLGRYITVQEAVERYVNLRAWYQEYGHFWVASGPYYLAEISEDEPEIMLRRFGAYPHPADRYLDHVVGCP